MIRMVAFFLANFAAHAANATFTIDPSASSLNFTLDAAMHTVNGHIAIARGTIRLDTSTGAATGVVVAGASTARTGNPSRDRRMRQEILESTQYPEILFTPLRVRGALAPGGESKVDIQGAFTIHGATHPVTVNTLVQMTAQRFKASTHLTVPYVAWGMKNPGTFLLRVKDSVEVELRLTGTAVLQ